MPWFKFFLAKNATEKQEESNEEQIIRYISKIQRIHSTLPTIIEIAQAKEENYIISQNKESIGNMFSSLVNCLLKLSNLIYSDKTSEQFLQLINIKPTEKITFIMQCMDAVNKMLEIINIIKSINPDSPLYKEKMKNLANKISQAKTELDKIIQTIFI